MTANRLTLFLVGLKNLLAKMRNSSLDTSHSARNLGFIFDEHLTFSDQITVLSSKPVTITFVTIHIPALPWFVNCLYHCSININCSNRYGSLQTWLL